MTCTYVLLLGLPGSGKGTLAQALKVQFECEHISCGDVFRDHFRKRTPFGQAALQYIERGKLTPDSETSEMFLAHLAALSPDSNYILEGYPRTTAQVESFEEHLRQTKRKLGAVIYLDVDKAELLSRIAERRICDQCGAIYNLKTKPPVKVGVCDVDGSHLVHRTDDKPDIVPARIDLYETKEREVIEHYERLSMLIPLTGSTTADVTTTAVSLLQQTLSPRR